MRKIIIILPLLLFSCQKEPSVTKEVSHDSVSMSQKKEEIPEPSKKMKDSIINNAPLTKEVLKNGVMRDVKNNTIIREADAELLPFTIGEEFTHSDEQFILKIKNFSKDNISAIVKPKKEDMNIRINQIKLPNGNYDGPFGKEISNYEIPQKGEVWFIIGKSNMASGASAGSFTISVE